MTLKPLSVLALDPGEKVGWARAEVSPDTTWDNLRHGITGLRDMAITVANRALEYDLIVCEGFRLAPDKMRRLAGSEFPTVQFIGMVRLSCWLDNTRLVIQQPTIKETANKTAPAWLEEIIANEPKSHDDAHNVDALRHLWFWTWEEYVRKQT